MMLNHLPPADRFARSGFSLLEVIIATAILAGSAMMLVSLIGLGTKFGSQSEQRSMALLAAQNILDEYLATATEEFSSTEIEGVTGGRWPMSYRLTVSDLSTERSGSSAAKIPGMYRLTVDVFEFEHQQSVGSVLPSASVSRLVHRMEADSNTSVPEGEIE